MKTIRHIADELGVSKQSIQKRLSREPLCTNIQPYISTQQGTKYIDDDGILLIKLAFSDRVYTPVADNVPMDKQGTVHTMITMLQQELNAKNEQIKELNARLAESNTALVAAQQTAQAAQALHAGTIQQQLPEPSSMRRGLFGWLDKITQNHEKKAGDNN